MVKTTSYGLRPPSSRHSDHPIGKLIAERAAAEGFHPVESKRFERIRGSGRRRWSPGGGSASAARD